jgi:hypothetical protein
MPRASARPSCHGRAPEPRRSLNQRLIDVLRKVLVAVLLLIGAIGAALVQGAPPASHLEPTSKPVFLASGLSEENLLTFSTAMARGGAGVLLLESARTQPYNLAFQQAFSARPAIPVNNQSVREIRGGFFGKAQQVVVCLPEPRPLLLQAACLAGALRAPLFVHHGTPEDCTALNSAVASSHTRDVYAVGKAYGLCGSLHGAGVHHVSDERAILEAYLRRQARHGRIKNLVVANPDDIRPGLGSMSTLAPWIALQRHAALVLTNDKGDNVEAAVKAAVQNEHLARVDTLILAGNLQAIPMERRPNPIHGKDAYIEMEPMTPAGSEVVSFAVGRLFHEDRGVVALMLARERLLAAAGLPRALVASNPGGSLPLLETFSRNTANELHNAGYLTTALCGRRTSQEELRRLLPSQTIFLWEGHHSTLVQDYRVHEWPESLQPSLVFLQSCLALQEPKAQPFLERGALGVIGTSSRTYSGSGGALSLAFFDALAYEHQSVGSALRSAKNFMLAFAQLKEQRLGPKSQLGGANIRAAWAFSLWGDPTVKLPRPTPPFRSCCRK